MNRRADRAVAAVLAALAYVPILLTSPGQVSADTKTYLTVDPGRLLASASSMWDPSVGAGTVPHQNIGYLFPLGPYYWLMDAIATPDWIAQRLVWGTLVFAAAFGTYRLCRWLGWTATTSFIAALAYGFSPYLLSYLARLSIILFPWAALPWMILLVARAARTRAWWPAATFAAIVAVVGSVNATALVLAGLGPVVWLVVDVASRRVAWRDALIAAVRIGALSLAVSLWWIVALRVQSGYGLPILRYTETYQSVASASTPAELLRGLGYWFFYGGDALDPWVGPSGAYIDRPALIVLGFALAAVSLLGLLLAFGGRGHVIALLAVGLVVSVGAAPLGGSSIYGSWFETFATETTAGLALRSTPRAAPLVVLALAMGLGAATGWRPTWRRRAIRPGVHWGTVFTAAAGVALVVQMFPWFTGRAASESILRDETLPAHVTELAAWLDENGDGRVYELPGSDFANHRWGGTVDPVLPGLIDRPYLARELVPQGGPATAELLNAIERRLADGWLEPEALPTIARLLGAQTIAVRNDLEHERYRLARPGPLWTDLRSALGEPAFAGPDTTDDTEIPLTDELTYARPDAAASFPTVAAFELGDAPRARAVAADQPTIVAGDGEALVDLAALGRLDLDHPILYAATLHSLALDGDLDAQMLGTRPWWVVTDTNRKEGQRWSTLGSNLGALETESDLVLDDDPRDSRLEVFEEAAGQQTLAEHRAGVADVRASGYGSSIVYTAEDAPWFAIDGDPRTAWRAGLFEPSTGLIWEVDLAEPTPAESITVLQPITGVTVRFITEVRITLDVGTDEETSVVVALDESSRSEPGQRIELPRGGFSSVRIEVLADSLGDVASYVGQPGIGLAEVVIPGADGAPIVDDRVVVVPDLAANAAWSDSRSAGSAADDSLSYLFTRQRIDPATPNRTAPEPAMRRVFVVPDERSFELVGQARLAAAADDATIAVVLGDPTPVVADRRIPGSPSARGAAAFDGDAATAWVTPLDAAIGAELRIDAPGDATGLTIEWLADELHSTPAVITVTGGDGRIETIDLVAADGARTSAPFEPLPGPWTVRIESINETTSPNFFSGVPQTLPVAITELQLDGVDLPTPAADATLPSACRDDLIALDGRPLAVRLAGTVADALARAPIDLVACEDVVLSAGEHRLDALGGPETGLDIDRLLLDAEVVAPRQAPDPIDTALVSSDRTSATISVDAAAAPSWLILAESWNPGWTASIDGDELGEAVLIDGYANGWLLPPSETERLVELTWTPQRSVVLALWASALAGAAVLAVLGTSLWRQRHRLAGSSLGAGRPLPWPPAVPIALVVVVALVVAGVAAAVVALAAALTAQRWFAPLVVIATIGIAGLGIAVAQWGFDYPPGPDWPSRFEWAVPLAWSAVAAVVGAAVARSPSLASKSGESTVADATGTAR